MKKHFFFDMDGTLTESRQPISAFMSKLLMRMLELRADIVIVSGARREVIIKQVGQPAEESAILAQNGNHAERASGMEGWKRELSWVEKLAIFNCADRLLPQFVDWDVKADVVDDRGCQVSLSLTGHNAPRDKKNACDPTRERRRELLKDDDLRALEEMFGIKCAIGGSTCLDFFTHSKGDNVKAYIEMMEWDPEECVYIGDALSEGGNDSSVVGIIETVEVDGPEECSKFINGAIDIMKTQHFEEDEEDEDDDGEQDL